MKKDVQILEQYLYCLLDKLYKSLIKIWLISTVANVTKTDITRSSEMYILFSK